MTNLMEKYAEVNCTMSKALNNFANLKKVLAFLVANEGKEFSPKEIAIGLDWVITYWRGEPDALYQAVTPILYDLEKMGIVKKHTYTKTIKIDNPHTMTKTVVIDGIEYSARVWVDEEEKTVEYHKWFAV